ncbi:MAG: hypothetical protein U9R19_11725 [Bacteroidota bacterium]|nr:hypothetical protein [Bacteroidota bacterium]
MRNLLRGITFVLLVLMTTNIMAQKAKKFTGIITYKLTVDGEMSEADKAQVEGTVTMTYGDGVYKMVMETMMMNQTQVIWADSVITSTEVMGQTMAFRMNKEQAEEMKEMQKGGDDGEEEEKPKVTILDETKMIAGYKCKKAEIEIGEDIMEVYFYDDLEVDDFMQEEQYPEINGMQLEYTMAIPGMEDSKLHFTASEVKKKRKIKSKEFTIPEGTKVMSFEELKAMMGG